MRLTWGCVACFREIWGSPVLGGARKRPCPWSEAQLKAGWTKDVQALGLGTHWAFTQAQAAAEVPPAKRGPKPKGDVSEGAQRRRARLQGTGLALAKAKANAKVAQARAVVATQEAKAASEKEEKKAALQEKKRRKQEEREANQALSAEKERAYRSRVFLAFGQAISQALYFCA